MSMHKLYVFVLFFITLSLSSLSGALVKAVSITDPPEPAHYAPIFVTGFQLTNQLDAIEIFNESPDPVDLSTWSIQYRSLEEGKTCNISLKDWLPAGGYVVAVANNGALSTIASGNENVLLYDSCLRNMGSDFTLTLNNMDTSQEIITPMSGAFVRKGLTKTYRTNKFSTDFMAINRSLYAGIWYRPPESVQLQISEILVNSRNCSPLETELDCSDYVKLYNPTDQPIDLSLFQIRNGYFGQSPTSSNTIEIEGIVEAGHYIIIPMTVTNSASWLWLEDSFGVKRYDNTVQAYEDGSSDTKKGQAYAYDVSDGLWKWTLQPTPSDTQSIFPVPPAEPVMISEVALAPCAEGQYRSEETNRCRSVVSEIASLVPCGPEQERNPVTNRCRSVTAVLGTSDLVPCKEGQERNPETNRCRNIASAVPQAEYAPEQVSEASNNNVLWWSLAIIGLAVAGYGVWEWRHEISNLGRKLGSFLNRNK